MTNDQRLQIFPTRMNLNIVKTRQKSAQKGHLLLKRKSDALQKKHREVQSKLTTYQSQIEVLLKEAHFAYTTAEFHGADLKLYLNECKKSKSEIKTSIIQISGVSLPSFELVSSNKPVKYLGKSGYSLIKCREKYMAVLNVLVELATLQNNFLILDEVLKGVNRRVNALEFLILPKLENTVKYINGELDEQDREEFYRLKKVQKLMKDNL